MHNFAFTMELHAQFAYRKGTGQIFTFKGDDDAWVFINGRLAIDLGGLHSMLEKTVILDEQAAALGLEDGRAYPLDFFFAERMAFGSHCHILTNLHLSQRPQDPTRADPHRASRVKNRAGRLQAAIRYTADGRSIPAGRKTDRKRGLLRK